MGKPLFDLFEAVAEELSQLPSQVITRKTLEASANYAPVLDDLKRSLKKGTTDEAIEEAVSQLRTHFADRGCDLPFDYDPATGRFSAVDPTYLTFIQDMRSIRSLGTRSRDFEVSV